MLAGNANIKEHLRRILLSTKGQYMRESNTHADYATIKQQEREIFTYTKKQYMKESNTLAVNAHIRPLLR